MASGWGFDPTVFDNSNGQPEWLDDLDPFIQNDTMPFDQETSDDMPQWWDLFVPGITGGDGPEDVEWFGEPVPDWNGDGDNYDEAMLVATIGGIATALSGLPTAAASASLVAAWARYVDVSN